MTVKEFFLQFVPVPALTFFREIKKLKQRMDRMENQIRDAGRETEQKIYETMDPELYAYALKGWYAGATGEILDLDHPEGYNAKIQWMKLYDPDPRKAVLADKVRVRDYVREKIGGEYLIPLLGVYRSAEEIDFDALPDAFVLKANHGSGWNAIVRNKAGEDLEALRSTAAGWLRTDYRFVDGFQLHYGDIPRRLLAEKYMENADGDMPDYKFWCFDGKVRLIEVIKGRSTSAARMAFYDPDWQRQPFVTRFPAMEEELARPDRLPDMIRIAERLSEGFAHVRVDLYLLDDGEIKFGELTFTTSSGACKWKPWEADRIVGEMLRLPIPGAGAADGTE